MSDHSYGQLKADTEELFPSCMGTSRVGLLIRATWLEIFNMNNKKETPIPATVDGFHETILGYAEKRKPRIPVQIVAETPTEPSILEPEKLPCESQDFDDDDCSKCPDPCPDEEEKRLSAQIAEGELEAKRVERAPFNFVLLKNGDVRVSSNGKFQDLFLRPDLLKEAKEIFGDAMKTPVPKEENGVIIAKAISDLKRRAELTPGQKEKENKNRQLTSFWS